MKFMLAIAGLVATLTFAESSTLGQPPLPPPPSPSCKAGTFKCHENRTDAMQCKAVDPKAKGADAEAKWRLLFPCPYGCVQGASDTVAPTCAKLVKKKKPTEEQGTDGK